MSKATDGWQILVEVTNLYRDMMRTTVEQTGMSKTRLEILDVLADVAEMSQADLQQHLGVEGPVVTRIVKQLEAEGLVTRRADPRDNRYTLVTLRADIREMRDNAELVKFKDTFGAQIVDGLDDEERAVLLRGLKRVQENVRALRDSPAEQSLTATTDKFLTQLKGRAQKRH